MDLPYLNPMSCLDASVRVNVAGILARERAGTLYSNVFDPSMSPGTVSRNLFFLDSMLVVEEMASFVSRRN